MPTSNEEPNKNAQFKSARRQGMRDSAGNAQPPLRRRGRERRLSVRSELRKQPDVQKIARALIALAIAQAEADAAAEQEGKDA